MSRALVVHVNRNDHHAVEAPSDGFEAGGPFVLRLVNHGAGCHLHLTFNGEIVPGTTLEDDNPYLPEGEALEVPVDVVGDLRPARGSVEVVTGYGQVSTTVEVEVTEDGPSSATGATSAAAGGAPAGTPSNATPPSGASRTAGEGTADAPAVPTVEELRSLVPEFTAATALVTALALLAIVAAAGAVRVLDGAAVTVGAIAVIATVVGSGIYLLVR